jgi:hypothetical protein
MTDVGLGGFPPIVTIAAAEESLLPSGTGGHHRLWTVVQLVSRPVGVNLNAHRIVNRTQPLTHGIVGIN